MISVVPQLIARESLPVFEKFLIGATLRISRYLLELTGKYMESAGIEWHDTMVDNDSSKFQPSKFHISKPNHR